MTQISTEASRIALLRQAGLRSTPQRVAIVREVFSQNHPTVAEVYESVRRQFPAIGLATVYNTLRSLTERGYVRELPFGDAMRFDVNVTPHMNLVCKNCGRIEDSSAANDLLDAMRSRIQQDTSFHPESQRVDVYGLCSACSGA
ncbi:MAG TPA: Fur family transcriptional regulator [Dehalococcoidia bacterium]|jgi:Fe2+ or Zn2+ uptake regulation protein|nr:Fur family transcriptional regulator [Dehalococcoidia bacterium]